MKAKSVKKVGVEEMNVKFRGLRHGTWAMGFTLIELLVVTCS